MNTRLKMALLLHSGESGFAIVIAVSLGLIMILVGLTLTMRSQGDQIVASSQKATEKSLAVAEKGIAYYHAFLNANRNLALYPDCRSTRTTPGADCDDPLPTTGTPITDPLQMSWSNASTIPEIASACNNSASTSDIETVYASTAWKAVDPNDPSKGQFRLVSYQMVDTGDNSWPAKGEIVVEGRLAQTTDNNVPKKAISRVTANIGIGFPNQQNVPIPGVWLGGNGTEDPDSFDNSSANANIIINNCDVTAAKIADMQTRVGSGYTVKKTNMQMPDVPTMPAPIVPDTTNNPPNPPTPGTIPLQFGSSASIPGNNVVGLTARTRPPQINGAVTFVTGFVDNLIGFAVQPVYASSIPDLSSGTKLSAVPLQFGTNILLAQGKSGGNSGGGNSGGGNSGGGNTGGGNTGGGNTGGGNTGGGNTGGITLPRINGAVDPLTGFADQPIQFNGQSTYVYSVTGDIPSGTTINVTPGQRVVIFLSGSIENNVEINHCGNLSASQCNPLNFQIYGTGSWGEQICMNGNRRIEAFILAPNYRVGVQGGGGGQGGIKGAIWAKTWSNPDTKIDSQDCASNTSNVVVEQTGNWNDLGVSPKFLPPPISGIREWKQTNATEAPPAKLNVHPYNWMNN
jgi:uncharacterized membrane protein YgcG